MANFRKSFNFRNGVQVDEDNFIVNSAGLVGIGTSVPTEFLDVRGSLKVVGVATIQDAFIGVVTVTNQLEVGITSLGSGIIAAKTGIVTYYGDARYLQGMPTSQWVDTDVGLGYTSIYAAGNVGVGTTDPRFTFQVGGNNNVLSFTNGVGINSSGDVIVAGIATITKMYGWGIGVTGLNAGDAIATGTLHNDRLPSNINKPTGIVTAATFIGNVTGNITGNVTGTASTAQSITGSPDLVVGVVTVTKLVADTIEVPSTGITTVSKLLHIGTGGTAFSALEGGRVGVGTALPTSEFQIRKASGSLLEVVSDSGEARISIGQSVGVGNNSGVLRFGNSANTFDIVNRDTGNLNMILHGGGSGIDTGRFDWIYGQTNNELMSLTHEGRLGLGITNPSNTLHVVGNSTLNGNAFVDGDLTVTGNLNGTLSLPSIFNGNVLALSGISSFSNIAVSAGSSIGLGTDQPTTDIDGFGRTIVVGAIGVGNNLADINNRLPDLGTIYTEGQIICDGIGIGTTSAGATGKVLNLYGNVEIHPDVDGAGISYISGEKIDLRFDNQSTIGIGTTDSQGAVDFRLAGAGFPSGQATFMLPPQVSTTVGLNTAGKEGALVFNTTTKKFQGYDGTSWHDLH